MGSEGLHTLAHCAVAHVHRTRSRVEVRVGVADGERHLAAISERKGSYTSLLWSLTSPCRRRSISLKE